MSEEKQGAPRAADMLADFVKSQTKEKISMEDFIEALGARAFGLAILFLALANLLIANVPGISTVLGLPIVLLSLQAVIGQQGIWLPVRLKQAKIKKKALEGMVARAGKILRVTEKWVKPRLSFLVDDKAERWIGAYCLLLGLVLVLPILFGNFLPALALALIALGMIEKDGLFAIAGFIVGLLAVAYTLAFFIGGAELIKSLLPG